MFKKQAEEMFGSSLNDYERKIIIVLRQQFRPETEERCGFKLSVSCIGSAVNKITLYTDQVPVPEPTLVNSL